MYRTPLPSQQRHFVSRLARSLVATLIVVGLAAGAARAQTVDSNMWTTNGSVYAIE